MKKSKLFLLTAIFLAFATSSCNLSGKTSEDEAFYRDFMNWFNHGHSQPVVIDEYTRLWSGDETYLTTKLHPIKNEDYELSQEVIDDFIAKNSVPSQLPKNMDIGVKYILITESEKEEMLKSQKYIWEAIKEKYPAFSGMILTLSSVGFDKAYTHALISYYFKLGGSGGGGYCVFEKETNSWVWKDCFRSWKFDY